MRGNQAIELTKVDKLLTEALDEHFTLDNCCGVLLAIDVNTVVSQNGFYDIYFECKRCKERIVLTRSIKPL